jgi:hypothetical protein
LGEAGGIRHQTGHVVENGIACVVHGGGSLQK